jgi:hypothetical protein
MAVMPARAVALMMDPHAVTMAMVSVVHRVDRMVLRRWRRRRLRMNAAWALRERRS